MQVFCLIRCVPSGAEKLTFAEQFLEGVPGQRATDLQPLRHDGGCDELVVGDFFVQLVVGCLVEEDQVVELIPHLSLGPLLLRIRDIVSTIREALCQKKNDSSSHITCEGPDLHEYQALHTFFLALPPDLLTGSLSFLDFPVSFFLSCLGG